MTGGAARPLLGRPPGAADAARTPRASNHHRRRHRSHHDSPSSAAATSASRGKAARGKAGGIQLQGGGGQSSSRPREPMAEGRQPGPPSRGHSGSTHREEAARVEYRGGYEYGDGHHGDGYHGGGRREEAPPQHPQHCTPPRPKRRRPGHVPSPHGLGPIPGSGGRLYDTDASVADGSLDSGGASLNSGPGSHRWAQHDLGDGSRRQDSRNHDTGDRTRRGRAGGGDGASAASLAPSSAAGSRARSASRSRDGRSASRSRAGSSSGRTGGTSKGILSRASRRIRKRLAGRAGGEGSQERSSPPAGEADGDGGRTEEGRGRPGEDYESPAIRDSWADPGGAGADPGDAVEDPAPTVRSADPPTLTTRESRDPSPEGPQRGWTAYHDEPDGPDGEHGDPDPFPPPHPPHPSPLTVSRLAGHSAGLAGRVGIEPLPLRPRPPATPRDVDVRRQIGFYDGTALFDDSSDGDSTLSTNFTGFGNRVDLDLGGSGMDGGRGTEPEEDGEGLEGLDGLEDATSRWLLGGHPSPNPGAHTEDRMHPGHPPSHPGDLVDFVEEVQDRRPQRRQYGRADSASSASASASPSILRRDPRYSRGPGARTPTSEQFEDDPTEDSVRGPPDGDGRGGDSPSAATARSFGPAEDFLDSLEEDDSGDGHDPGEAAGGGRPHEEQSHAGIFSSADPARDEEIRSLRESAERAERERSEMERRLAEAEARSAAAEERRRAEAAAAEAAAAEAAAAIDAAEAAAAEAAAAEEAKSPSMPPRSPRVFADCDDDDARLDSMHADLMTEVLVRVPRERAAEHTPDHPQRQSRQDHNNGAPGGPPEPSLDAAVTSELRDMKRTMRQQEIETDDKVRRLEDELRRQTDELRSMEDGKSRSGDDERLAGHLLQLTNDLESYRDECAGYRERILQRERDNADVEQMLYEEKKKVLSLEAENAMLLNIADGNKDRDAKSERAREAKLAEYKDQCARYRDQVLELERRVESAEEALESTGQMATSLERDKGAMAERVERAKAERAGLESTIGELKSRIGGLEEDLAAGESERSRLEAQVAEARKDAEAGDRTIVRLGEENSELAKKLEAATEAASRAQSTEEQRRQLEEEVAFVRRRNEELLSRHDEMSKEVDDAVGLASNTERLRRMVADNEAYISKLQGDLSKARSANLESLRRVRSEHSAEAEAAAEKLQREKDGRREAEVRNVELADRVASLERSLADLEQSGSRRAKSQDDEISKLTEIADGLRRDHAAGQADARALRQKAAESERAHAAEVREMSARIESLEREKSEVYETLASVNREFMDAKERASRAAREHEAKAASGDAELERLRLELSEVTRSCSDESYLLHSTVRDLRRDLQASNADADASRERLAEATRRFGEAAEEARGEVERLRGDVGTIVKRERLAMAQLVRRAVERRGDESTRRDLEAAVEHSSAMAAVRAEKRDVELLLDGERRRSAGLEEALGAEKSLSGDLRRLADSMCTKLSVESREGLLDAIDDVQIEMSDVRIQCKTLWFDVQTAQSSAASLEHEKDQLEATLGERDAELRAKASDVEGLSDALRLREEKAASLEAEIENLKAESTQVQSQMKSAFDADRKSQDKAVEDLILANEQKCQKLLSRQEELGRDLEFARGETASRDEQLVEMQAKVELAKRETKDISAQYNDSRGEVLTLLEKLTSSQEKTDQLTAHYMAIEDDLRQQIRAVHFEKDKAEKNLAMEKKETDRQILEFVAEKKELASKIDELSDSLRELTDERKDAEEMSLVLEDLRGRYDQVSNDLEAARKDREQSNAAKTELEDRLRRVLVDLDSAHKDREDLAKNELALQSTIAQLESTNAAALSGNDFREQNIRSLQAANDDLSKDLARMTKERDDLRRSLDDATSRLDFIESSNREREAVFKDIETALEAERIQQSSTIDSLEQSITTRDNLVDLVSTLESEIAQLREVNESTAMSVERRLDAERLAHASNVEELQSNFDAEIQQQREKTNALQNEVRTLRDGQQQLQAENENLTELKAKNESQIQVLKDSLKESLEEALRLGSKVTSEQARLAELVTTVATFEGENADLKYSLEHMASYEQERQELMTTYEKVDTDKKRLQSELVRMERQLFEAMNSLTHYELKLTRAEHERDHQASSDSAEIRHLSEMIAALELSKANLEQQLSTLASALEQRGEFDTSFKEMLESAAIKDEQSNLVIRRLEQEINARESSLSLLAQEKDRLVLVNEELVDEKRYLQSKLEETEKANLSISFDDNGSCSIYTDVSRASLKQTASELESTIKAIKHHHSTAVARYKAKLKEAQYQLKVSQKKVKELTQLLEENTSVIVTLQNKMRGKTKSQSLPQGHIHITADSSSDSIVSD